VSISLTVPCSGVSNGMSEYLKFGRHAPMNMLQLGEKLGPRHFVQLCVEPL